MCFECDVDNEWIVLEHRTVNQSSLNTIINNHRIFIDFASTATVAAK